MSDVDTKALEVLVRKVLTEILIERGGSESVGCESGSRPKDDLRQVDKSGIMSIRIPAVRPEPFDTGKAGDRVFLSDVLSLSESPRLGFGVMELDKTSFDWTLNYDEVDYVIEGRLEVKIDGRTVAADKGESIFIPKGSHIAFCTPDFVRFIYITYPADWASQKD
jgi:ethanolamine utilization protein EutQ